MGLMIVGFGLKDSIFAIVDIQYGELQLYDGTVIMAEGASEEEKEEVVQKLESEWTDRWKEFSLRSRLETEVNGMRSIWMCQEMKSSLRSL